MISRKPTSAPVPKYSLLELHKWNQRPLLQEENYFSKIKVKCKQNNVILNTKIINGISVSAQIVEYAESNNIDLIVVGTRGRSGFNKLLLGSVASGVITYAHCPVMVVK